MHDAPIIAVPPVVSNTDPPRAPFEVQAVTHDGRSGWTARHNHMHVGIVVGQGIASVVIHGVVCWSAAVTPGAGWDAVAEALNLVAMDGTPTD